jgi:hypothetical protein
MTEYRLYTVESDGRFIGSRTFTADSDDDAAVWAKQQIEDHSVELWSGPRLVRRLDPAEKRAAEAVLRTRSRQDVWCRKTKHSSAFLILALLRIAAHISSSPLGTWLSSVMRTPVALPPTSNGWSSACQSVAVSNNLHPLKNALQRRQRSCARRLKVPQRGLSASSWFAKPAEPRQLLV